MSSSSSDGSLQPRGLAPGLTPRLAGALAASIALHLYAVVLMDSLPRGMRWGELALLDAGNRDRTLSVALRREASPWVPPVAPIVPEPSRSAPPAVPPPAGSPGAGPASAPALSPLPAPTYFQSRDLDVKPGILVRVEPEYPEAAARRFLSGRVVVRLLIDEAGKVENVAIVSAEPPGYFEESARKAFLAARFSPGMKGGKAVRVQVMLEVTFESPVAPRPPANVSS